ncbi:MAG: DUF11 domain-containing protein [Saprospiraceae bacterium]|nr:DUF11 domain-containing protein [Saprospiraceae bacterium]
MTDYIPTGLTLNNPGATWTTASGGKTNLVSAIPILAPGDSIIRTISFTIDANFQGTTLRNWAEISSATNALNQPDIDSDPDATNFNQTGETNDLNDDNVISQDGKTGGDEDDHDPAEITVSQIFDLALKKTLSSAGPFIPGSTVNFEIKIYNQGTITATNVNVTDYIPTGLTLNNPGTTWTTTSGGKTNLVTAIPTLAPGDSIVRTISFTIDANFQGTTLRNWAEISSATNALNQADIDSDPDATNFNQTGETNDLNDDNVISQNGKTGGDEDDHDPAEITVLQIFDLALKKTLSSAEPFTPGSIVNFEIRIFNQGTITATNVNVTDYIPTGLTLNNPGVTWTAVSGGKTNLVTGVPTLAPGDSIIRTISFTIDANFQGTTLRNWAEISAATNVLNQPDIDSDPDASNFNQTGETNDLNDDNVVSQNGKTGGDEDDHDPAEITVSQSFIGFNVWKDKNGDGVQSIGELPLQGVIVSLYDCNTNALLRRDTTDQFGNYGFEALPGNKTYFVSFDARPLNMPNCNWTFKEKGTDKQFDSNANLNGITDCIHLDWGERDSTVDAGFVELAAYGDYVWHDRDVDGQQESGEEGVGGVTVMLFDAVSNQVERTSLTDQYGYYFFDHLLPKQYYAKFSKPANFESTVSNQGSELSDNDVDGSNGVGTNETTYLSPGETDRTWDYGIYKCSCISGDVWYDLNNDGIYQDLENGINGVSVFLVDAMTNQVVASTVTRPKPNTASDDGYYTFCNCVRPGMYYIKFDKPGNLAASQAFRGVDSKKYSHVTHANGINTTNKITVLSGVEIKDINAGYQNQFIVGNFVWLDSNQNGIQDTGEKPVEGVKVMAVNPAGTMVSESITGSDGIYHLDGICEGDYYIKFKPLAMYSFTRPNMTNEDLDSDVSGANGEGTTAIMRLTGLTNIQTVDAGLVVGVLPIEWLDFSGRFNGTFMELNWLTAAEKDNSHFIVERRNYSEVDFVEIGNVNSASTLNNLGSKYSFDDFDTESNGIYYYRIKQVDRSGKYSYSKVIAINKSTTNDVLVELYPNPANNILHLDIQTTKETNLHFEITDIAGNNVLDQELIEMVKSGRHLIDINTSNFTNGNYIISIKSQQSISHHKFVISK